jgi:hypothetical protein
MRTAHFDCFSGISGDMTLGALVGVGVPAAAIQNAIASLGLNVSVRFEDVRRGGFAATYARVEAPHEHAHRHLHHIEAILDRGTLSDAQRGLAKRIFRRLGEAEAAAHGVPIEKNHFHEVGALDSIADIAGAAVGLDLLGVERFTSSSVPPGGGTVKAAHGVMPVPPPGTAELLRGVPLAPSPAQAELTTPTGAAILTTVVNAWTDAPRMTIDRIGHGAGTKDFPSHANILRLFVGTAGDAAPAAERDAIWVLETNLDDVPAEIVGYCFELLFAAGAVDVTTQPIAMKKNRPGILLTVLTPEAAISAIEEVLFRETGTFGIRRTRAERSILQRKTVEVTTPWGPVRGKLGWREGGPAIFSPEYEDCARLARENNVPLRQVYDAAARGHASS